MVALITSLVPSLVASARAITSTTRLSILVALALNRAVVGLYESSYTRARLDFSYPLLD
jgi:hypothetical protein